MQKRVFGRKFNKDINQRKALFRGLMRSLALHESIRTTEAKAKAIRGEFESHITKAKKGEVARYHLTKHLAEDAVERLIKEIAPRMKDRNGGYTRIIRLGNRLKDNASMVKIELVEKKPVVLEEKGESKKKKVSKKTQKVSTKKVETKAAKPETTKTAVAEKKQGFKPLTSLKQMVTRQKKGSS